MEDILLVHRKSNRNFAEALADNPIWKTCLRKILFCREEDLHTLSHHLEPQDQILRGEQALSLLLEILCGLHSPVIGETEVFGQFRAFVESRKQMNDSLFSEGQKWLHFINTEVKKTRSEHLVGLGSQSYGSLLRRHTKDLDSITICGSGQLALEILPWLAHKKSLQIICRNPAKLQSIANQYNNLKISTYNEASVEGAAMIVAAPLEDKRILDLLSRGPQTDNNMTKSLYDLRGEENSLLSLLEIQKPLMQLMSLQQFFAEIEETRKDTQSKLQDIKNHLLEKSLAFIHRTELHPLGWDDICA